MKLSYRSIELALARKKMNFSDLKSVSDEIIKDIENGAEIEPKTAGMLAEELGVEVEKIESNELLEELQLELNKRSNRK